MVLNPQLLGMIKKTRELLAGHAKHVSDERDREKSRRRQAKQRRIKTVLAQGTFAGRGFSTRTCNVLREHGVSRPNASSSCLWKRSAGCVVSESSLLLKSRPTALATRAD